MKPEEHSKSIIYGRRLFLKKTSLAAAATALVPLYARCAGDKTLRFAILSDLHYEFHRVNHFSIDSIRQYADIINQLGVDFVVLNGDNVGDDSGVLVDGIRSHDRFREAYDSFYQDFLGLFNPQTDFYPVLGNHDPFFPGQRNPRQMIELMNEETFLDLHLELVRKCTHDRFNNIFYSWDEGDWHFLSVACGGTDYLEAIGMFRWIEQDLSANRDRPVIIFNHVPPLGIGMTDSYWIDVKQKGLLMDLYTRYENVKYVFSGHIHNSTKVSVRSARNFKGTNFIVCPTHVWDQRPFGKKQKYPEELAHQCHGFIVCDLKDGEAELYSIPATETKIPYPGRFEEYTYASNPINFYPLPFLPPATDADNILGDDRLKGWYTNYVYNEEEDPSYIREVSKSHLKSGKTPIHLALKGRTNVHEDFQNIGQANSVYKYFEIPGRTGRCRISLSYLLDRYQFAETDLSKHPNPTGAELRPGRFRYQAFYNLGLITVGFLKDGKPVYEYEINFGKWMKGSQNTEPDIERLKYRFSIFDFGEWVHPGNKKTVLHEIETATWKEVQLDLSKEAPEDLEFDRVLVAFTLSNDGLSGHEMSVFVDDIDIIVA